MCDRTQDFLQCVQQVHSAQPELSKSSKKQSASRKSKTEFNESVSDIARGIHRTSSLLIKLSNLVKKQGLFDDPTEEINTLIHHIKQDLDDLNSRCDTAQNAVDSQKGFFTSEATQSTQHHSKVVSGLKTELMTTTKDFKSVLELRSHKMKDQQQRKNDLVGKSVLSPMRDLLTRPPAHPSSSSTATPYPSSGTPYSSSLNPTLPSPYRDPEAGSLAQETTQLLLQPLAQENYYEAREQAVGEVQRTIGELGTLFKRLSTMLAEQQEMVERIDEDVESAVENANAGKEALLRVYEGVKSNRGLYMKLGAILGIFILFFVLFVL